MLINFIYIYADKYYIRLINDGYNNQLILITHDMKFANYILQNTKHIEHYYKLEIDKRYT